MARCKKCGRTSLFLKLNKNGLCSTCEATTNAYDLINRLEDERQERRKAIDVQRTADLRYFREHVFPLPANNAVILEMQSVWHDEIHDEDAQLNLQLKSIYVPIAFLAQRDTLNFVFTNYTCSELFYTTPTRCTCNTFKKSKKPCEHIYRLILLQPQMEISFVYPDLDTSLYGKFMALSPECRLDFVKKINYIGKNGKDYIISDYLYAEAEQGLVLITNDLNYKSLLSKMTKDEIILWLSGQGINSCSFNWSKARVIAWTINNAKPQLEDRFSHLVHVALPPEIQLWQEKYRLERERSTFMFPNFWYEECHRKQEEEEFGQSYK